MLVLQSSPEVGHEPRSERWREGYDYPLKEHGSTERFWTRGANNLANRSGSSWFPARLAGGRTRVATAALIAYVGSPPR